MARERLPKELKNQIWDKCTGHCAYCGVELSKGWHADHVIPVVRGGPDDIMNLMPVCPKCNNFKASFTLEQFRHELSMQVTRARKYSVNFKMAERYNQIVVKETPIVFYFEKIGQTFDANLVLGWINRGSSENT